MGKSLGHNGKVSGPELDSLLGHNGKVSGPEWDSLQGNTGKVSGPQWERLWAIMGTSLGHSGTVPLGKSGTAS